MMAAQAAADGSPGAWCDRSTRGDVICPQALSTGVGNCVPYFEGKGAGSSPVEVRRIIAPASSATPRRRAVLATFFPPDRTQTKPQGSPGSFGPARLWMDILG